MVALLLKPHRIAAVAAGLVLSLLAQPAQAVFTYHADITFTTDYIFRGVSQTNQRPVIQGGYVLDTGIGLQFGTWGSNVYFPGSEASLELDSFITMGFDLKGDLGIEVGVIDYSYPGAGILNFSEIFANVSILGFSANVYRSENYEASGSSATWSKIAYRFPLLSQSISLGLEYGRVNATERIFGKGKETSDSYSHYSFYLAFRLTDSELRFTATNSNRVGCTDTCRNLTTLAWTKAF